MATAVASDPVDRFANLKDVLSKNVNLSNRALAGIVEANLTNFSGTVTVSGQGQARVIHITPCGICFKDLLIRMKRWLVGVQFGPENNNDINASLAEGRRIAIFIPDKGLDYLCDIEASRDGAISRCNIL